MITVFNRKQVFASFSMEKQAEAKNILDHNGINYYEKVINRRSASSFGNGTRSITGSFGEKASYMYEYIIYVHKKDFELANRYIVTVQPSVSLLRNLPIPSRLWRGTDSF